MTERIRFPERIKLPAVSVTIDGGNRSWSPKVANELRWTGALDMGDATCSFDITPDEYRAARGQFEFPALVRVDEGPECIWAGLLNEVGIGTEVATISAAGYGTVLNYIFNPLLAQVMDLSVWDQVAQLPWMDPDTAHPDFSCSATPDGYLRWVTTPGDGSGIQGFVATFPDVPLTRFGFYNGAPSPNPGTLTYFQIWRASSYAPARTYWYREPPYNQEIHPPEQANYEQIYGVTTVQPGHPAYAVAPGKPYDSIIFVVGGPSPEHSGGMANVKNVRINSDITQGDQWSPQQGVEYIAGRRGWRALPSPSGINILPYYSEAGERWSMIMDYMARASGGTWRAHGLSAPPESKAQLQIQPWAKTPEDDSVWIASRTDPGTTIEIQPFGRRINAVFLSWEDVAGFPRTTEVRKPDREFDELGADQQKEYSLPGRFPVDSLYPEQFANMLLDTYSKPQFAGTIKGAMLRKREGMRLVPMRRVQPGDTIYVPEDKGNGVGGMYPVHSTDSSLEESSLGIGSIAPQVDLALFDLEQQRLRNPQQFQ